MQILTIRKKRKIIIVCYAAFFDKKNDDNNNVKSSIKFSPDQISLKLYINDINHINNNNNKTICKF